MSVSAVIAQAIASQGRIWPPAPEHESDEEFRARIDGEIRYLLELAEMARQADEV